MHKRRDFFISLLFRTPNEFSDTKKRRAVTIANAATLGCITFAISALCPFMPFVKRNRKNHPGVRSTRPQTQGKNWN